MLHATVAQRLGKGMLALRERPVGSGGLHACMWLECHTFKCAWFMYSSAFVAVRQHGRAVHGQHFLQ